MLVFAKNRFGLVVKFLMVLSVLAIAGCAQPMRTTEINDPHEIRNRKVHALNKSLDLNILKPVSGTYTVATEGPLRSGINNFSSNLALPGTMLNDLLQLKLPEFFGNGFRFIMNSTVGLGGIFDVATQNGLMAHPTDFGETLFVWGVPEGRFVELPIYSARTERETVGIVVDYLIDPTNFLLPKYLRTTGTISHVLHSIGDRGQYANIVESVLYESEDSYAQTRLLYLQSRRQHLYGELAEDDLEDPYAE